jgi:hypothetical protein
MHSVSKRCGADAASLYENLEQHAEIAFSITDL